MIILFENLLRMQFLGKIFFPSYNKLTNFNSFVSLFSNIFILKTLEKIIIILLN